MSTIAPMPNIPNLTEEEIFQYAAAMPAEERASYLEHACDDNAPLRKRIERLLGSHDSQGFMDVPISPEIQAEIERLKPEDAGDSIGHYKLLQEIGQGGFGTVWMAEQSQPVVRRVALKVIKLGMDTKEVLARFDQERQALAMMDHPNIARVFDAGMTRSGRPYFVMELVRGKKLTAFCDDHELSMNDRLELFIRICNAVQHAHQKGIIHRDLKPSNILVGMTDGVPHPKVIDFGVAKATQSRITEQSLYTEIGQIVGTPLYMSPEQAETTTLDVDTRSDVYSLGVLLYELLTGTTPFGREAIENNSLETIRHIIKTNDPKRPSAVLGTLEINALQSIAHHRHTEGPSLIRTLKRDLDWIVMRAIEKDRNRRYDSASAFAEDIARHLRSEPVVARPPTIGYRARRLIMRNKTAFLTTGIIAATLVAATFVSITQLLRANAALDELRATAPAFASQARELADKEQYDQAVEKLGYAIKLQPESTQFRLSRADILQALGRLEDAAKDYRSALTTAPHNQRAADNLTLCEKILTSPRLPDGNPRPESLQKLFDAMKAEKRPAAEMMHVAKKIGREKEIALDLWKTRLKGLPNATAKPISERITARADGLLELDLTGTGVSDLRPLTGMPLGDLKLNDCRDVRDLSPLRGITLTRLGLKRTAVSDLHPLADCPNLKSLDLSHTPASDLRPLAQLPLRWLSLAQGEARDLTPLSKLPIEHLDLENARGVGSLAALAEMPLDFLNCMQSNVTDFSPLANLPLRTLYMHDCTVGDLGFLRAMPLELLDLSKTKSASNFAVLAGIKSLEELTLPSDLDILPDVELDAIETLRTHPALNRLSNHPPEKAVPLTLRTVPTFWAEWPQNISWQRALRRLNVNARVSRQKDGTWHVTAWEQSTLTDLSVFKGANISLLDVSQCRAITDLRPLIGLPIKVLRIPHTSVTDLSPIREMQLQELWCAETPITDLSPLAGLPLRRIFMDKCRLPVDVTPLASIATLEELILPERPTSLEKLRNLENLRHLSYTYSSKTGKPARTTPEFWREWESFTWLPALARLDFTFAQLPDGITTLIIRDPAFNGLSLLTKTKLTGLDIRKTGVTDLAPLAAISTLQHLTFPEAAKNSDVLRKMPALKRISTKPTVNGAPEYTADIFWFLEEFGTGDEWE